MYRKIVVFIGVMLLIGTLMTGGTVFGAAKATLSVDNTDPNCSDTSGGPYCTIQAAIDAAAPGDTINVAVGTYAENVTIDKQISLIGAGSDTTGTVITQSDSGAGDSHVGVIQLAASGNSETEPILIKDLRIEPDHLAGISVGRFTEATGTSISFIELDNVKVIGTNTNPNSEQERGLYVDLTSTLQHLVVKNSAFDDLTYGWYFHKEVSNDTSTVQFVDVSDTTFNHNNLKGIYAEKLSDATFENCTFDQNGFSDSGVPSYFLPWMAGVDINLKAGTYQNLTFTDCTITNNALAGAKEGVGIAFKERGTGDNPSSSYSSYPAHLSNVTINGGVISGNERGVRLGEPGKGNAGPTNVVIHNACISGNVQTYTGTDGSAYGGVVNQMQAGIVVDASNNWWGDATGPYHPTKNPNGLGDEITDGVDFEPYLDACGGNATGNWQNVTTGDLYATLQSAVDAAASGDVISPVGDTESGGATITTAGVTIDLDGKTGGPGSPFLTVTAADVVVQNGVLDGGGSSDPAILVQSGGDNFRMEDVEVKGWEDGVELAASVTSFKLVSNWLHDNNDAGLQVDSGVVIDGITTIEGNLFKDNGGNGVQNDSGNNIDATYNSWGDNGGPAGTNGDGVSADVTSDPWTFAEIFLDMEPDTDATLRNVNESESFDVALKMDAVHLSGISFKIIFDPDMLSFNGISWAAPWDGAACLDAGTDTNHGIISYACNFQSSYEWTDASGKVATINFTATGAGLTGNGPWDTYLDIAHDEADTSAGAIGGVKVFVNNAGYGAPSDPDRDITDTDDGQVHITGIAKYKGFIDLQGRGDDTGGVITVYDQQATSGSTALAQGTSDAGGGYVTDYISPHLLTVGSTYWLQVDARLYLPTTVKYPDLATDWAHSKLLDTRPFTDLNTVKLLGGDATNDDYIDISDAGCIGGAYGGGPAVCGTNGSSDVNADGQTDLLDLVLMGGNFNLDASPWTP